MTRKQNTDSGNIVGSWAVEHIGNLCLAANKRTPKSGPISRLRCAKEAEIGKVNLARNASSHIELPSRDS